MSNEELAARIRDGEEGCITQLWLQVERFVSWKAFQYAQKLIRAGNPRGVTEEDLAQEGYFALLEAVRSHRPEEGNFLTWLSWQLKKRFREAAGLHGTGNQMEPLDRSLSLDSAITGEDGEEDSWYALIQDPQDAIAEAEEQIHYRQLQSAVRTAMEEELTEQQRDVLKGRIWEEKTLEQVGEDLAIPAEAVRNCEKKAITRLRYGKNRARFLSFWEYDHYTGTGLRSFISSGMSAQERYVLMTEKRQSNGNQKP